MKLNFVGLLKLAAKAGPVVYALTRQFAPQIQRMMRDNPEAFASLTGRFSRVIGTQSEKSTKGLAHRTAVLRDQVTYLYASAHNAEAAKQSIAWRNELEALERAIPVLDAMTRRRKSAEKKQIEKRLDALSSEILSASLIETIEDAEVVTNPHPLDAPQKDEDNHN